MRLIAALIILSFAFSCSGQEQNEGKNKPLSTFKEFTGVFHMPLPVKAPTYITPKAMVIKNQQDYQNFVSMIPQQAIGKRREMPASDDPLLKLPAIDFDKEMLLVVFRGETIYVFPKIFVTIEGDKMKVNIDYPPLGDSIYYARPYGVGTYRALLLPRFDGEILYSGPRQHRPHAHKVSSIKPMIPMSKPQMVTVLPTYYLEFLPSAAKVNPEIAIKIGTFFRIASNRGSYVAVEFANGKFGYMPRDKKCWAKMISVCGIVIHKQWNKSMESYLAGGSDYFLLDISGQKNKGLPKSIFLRPSRRVSFASLEKFSEKLVKVRGIYHRPKGENINPISQHPVDFDGNPIARPGSGEGIKVYAIDQVKQ